MADLEKGPQGSSRDRRRGLGGIGLIRTMRTMGKLEDDKGSLAPAASPAEAEAKGDRQVEAGRLINEDPDGTWALTH